MLVLVLGGARSGKSDLAEAWAARLPAPVTYVATGWRADADMAARIERHRARRPADWATVEAGPDLASALVGPDAPVGTVLVDALGTWVAAHHDFEVDLEGLCAALAGRAGDTVVVSDEVGLGVHPETAVGNRFRDVLGTVNRAVAAQADEVVLVVAGRVLRLAPAADVLP